MQPLKSRQWNIFQNAKKCGIDSLSSWSVAIACTMVNFLVMGSSMSNAVLFVSYMETFGISRKQAAWPYSLWHSCLCVGGPLAGFFSQHFTIRAIVRYGTAAIAIGACLCFFANSILYITICMGILQGLGSAMPVILNPVSINQHFLQSRGIASGMIHAGSTSGRIVFPLLYAYLLTEYGLRGSYLLVGGLLFHCQIASFFYKLPPKDSISNPSRNPPSADQQTESGSNTTESTKATFSKLPYILIPNVQNNSTEKQGLNEGEYLKLASTAETEFSSDKTFLQIKEKDKSSEISTPKNSLRTSENTKVACDGQMSPKNGVRKALSTYLSTLLFAMMNPTYLILTLSFALFLVCTVLFSTVYIDLAIDRGISKKEAVFLMSLSAMVEMVGRIFWGWFSDKQILSRKNMLVLNLVGLSITFGLFPLFSSYEMFLLLTILRSLVTDAHMLINLPIVMGETLGLERLPVALGFTRFVTGVFGFMRPPILGYFRDIKGSYDLLFLTMSTIMAGAASLWILESFLYKRTVKRNSLQEENRC